MSRTSARGAADVSREGSVAHQSPQISGNRTTAMRQPSPDVSGRDYPYSSSVPSKGPSPLYDR